MKLRYIITGFIIIAAISLHAQQSQKQGQRQGPPPIPNDAQIEKMMDELATKLKLDDQQKEDLMVLYKEHFAEVKIKVEQHKKQHQGHKNEMETLRKDFETKVKAKLTEDQVVAFDEFRKNRKGQRPQKGKKEKIIE